MQEQFTEHGTQIGSKWHAKPGFKRSQLFHMQSMKITIHIQMPESAVLITMNDFKIINAHQLMRFNLKIV